MTPNPKTRHSTSTGFVIHGDATLLHWHRKVGAWLPPGGHIEPNEDPVEAVLREISEETGFTAEIVPTQPLLDISNLKTLPAPYSILLENVVDAEYGEHQHIDHIYFARLTDQPGSRPPAPEGWLWVSLDALQSGTAFVTPEGKHVSPPEDVLKTGAAAILHVSRT